MKTVAQIISYVDGLVANVIPATDKYSYLSEIIEDIKEYNTAISVADTNTDTNVSIYGLPAGIGWSDLYQVLLCNTTYAATNTSTNLNNSTTRWTDITYKGFKDAELTYQYNEINTSQITIFGLSTENKMHLRFKYNPLLNFSITGTSDSTTILEMDNIITHYVQDKLAAKVCRSGAFPQITLGNNYESEAIEKLAKVKLNKRKADLKRSSKKISYKGWW